MPKLIVGLGNYGSEYEYTRHNIGFLLLDRLRDIYALDFKYDKKFMAEVCIKTINSEKVFFLKPMTYMNLSGESIYKIMNYYKLDIDDIIVIVDDLNLELGAIRVRYKGSSGGHNGLKNIEANLHTNAYKRIRIGIGAKGNAIQKDYVLSKFSTEEINILDKQFILVSEAISDFIANIPFEKILTKYNGLS